jgi:hypothetical protein
VDNSGDGLPPTELGDILARLVAADAFEFRATGGEALALDAPQVAHIQVAGRLYRLIVLRREARIEPF